MEAFTYYGNRVSMINAVDADNTLVPGRHAHTRVNNTGASRNTCLW